MSSDFDPLLLVGSITLVGLPSTGTRNRNESAHACVVNDLLAKSGVAVPFELSLRIGPPLTVPAYSSWSPSFNRVGLRLKPAPQKGARMDDLIEEGATAAISALTCCSLAVRQVRARGMEASGRSGRWSTNQDEAAFGKRQDSGGGSSARVLQGR